MSASNFSKLIKTSKGDEYYTPEYAVKIIIPYLQSKQFKKIWCPFDKQQSQFVKVLEENGFEVHYGHIDDGQDFFETLPPEKCDAIVSNPPFSKRQAIFERLFEIGLPFAMIMNFNGLFDAKKRHEMFSKNRFELLIPKGRISFFDQNMNKGNKPNFQSVYVCSGILDNQITFCEMEVEN